MFYMFSLAALDPTDGFEAVDEWDWPLKQAEMPDPGFRGLRADSPGKTVLDGGIGAGYGI